VAGFGVFQAYRYVIKDRARSVLNARRKRRRSPAPEPRSSQAPTDEPARGPQAGAEPASS